jgi:nicotinamide riboside transporter PnuC
MDNKKGMNFILVVVAFILGATLFKHFDFKVFSFKMPALDIIFLITFIVSIYLLIKDYNKQPEK